MKKLALLFITLVSVAMVSCQSKDETASASVETLPTGDQLKAAYATQDSLLTLLNDITQGMQDLKNLENIVTTTNDLNGESSDTREKIRQDMNAIQAALAERRQRLEQLEARLRDSNNQNATLLKSIEALKAQIASQESSISELRKQLAAAHIQIDELNKSVEELNTTVETVTAEKEATEQTNQQLTNELNTVYYVVGTKKELKDHKIIESGFLRKTKVLPDDFQASYFTKADRTKLTSLATGAKKATIKTAQPKDSYQIVTDANGLQVINITNPDKFWEKSTFLVVEVKN